LISLCLLAGLRRAVLLRRVELLRVERLEVVVRFPREVVFVLFRVAIANLLPLSSLNNRIVP